MGETSAHAAMREVMPMTGFLRGTPGRTVTSMTTVVRATRVLLILLLALLAISFVMAVGTSSTGSLEKFVLLLLIAGCVYAAAKITTLSAWMMQRLRH